MTELELDTVAVRVTGPNLSGDAFLGALISAFPESSEGPFPEWRWISPAESSPGWTGRINVRTFAGNFTLPPVPEEAVVCLAGVKQDVLVVEQTLTSWFHVSREEIDDDPYEVCLRLRPTG
ncbi:hypothetical protein ABTX77_38100 [Streptomyces sp. NPDC097704]|uniref:hypothetical protein n=1 Tax=Streptomyces sp. NPDC097704 TaxID=3157101 RepID=UPI003333ACB7